MKTLVETPMAELPSPRLQLSWERNPKGDQAWPWLCWYELFIPATRPSSVDGKPVGDIRATSRATKRRLRYGYTNRRDFIVVLGCTRAGHERAPYLGPPPIDTPFRDGAHASWDGDALKLPTYVTCDGRAYRVERDAPR